jgi:NAD(P)-dependent dehydrogenase (short-subunit alcohol dehydrogenase family)
VIEPPLEGKLAVITGAASGIGRGMAEAFVDAGMRVILADVESRPLAVTVDQLRSDGGDVCGVVTDVSDPGSVDALAATVVGDHGDVHVLACNAGVVFQAPAHEATVDDWRWVLGVNLFGVVNMVRSFLPTMLAHGEPAYVLATSSMAALRSEPFPGLGVYKASKAAVLAYCDQLADELAGTSVTVGVLLPGPVVTDISRAARNRPGEWEVPPPRTMEERLADGYVDVMLPDEVGRIVLDAVRTRRRYVVTHPRSWPDVDAYQRAVRAAFGVPESARPGGPT